MSGTAGKSIRMTSITFNFSTRAEIWKNEQDDRLRRVF